MRDTTIGTALLTAGVLATATLAPSCSDALRVEPPAASLTSAGAGAAGGGGSDGTGGEGATMTNGDCISSADCSAPTGVCDTVRGECVECLSTADCLHQPGTQCSMGACACADGESFCAGSGCVDLEASMDHCGSCGTQCLAGCNAGSCAGGWAAVSNDGAPSPRANHVAVWTGSVMIVWGGQVGTNTVANTSTGGMYDPATHTWTPTSMVDAPSPRRDATAVWTGDRMIVWGGHDGQAPYLDTGGVFDPATNTWEPTTLVSAPSQRHRHTAVWTGEEMVVFGGFDGNELSNGGHYDPEADAWEATGAVGVARADHTAVWAADVERMVVWGGFGDTAALSNTFLPNQSNGDGPGGQSYDPSTKLWGNLSEGGEPTARGQHTAVHDGTSMLVWGGTGNSGLTSTGARYTTSWAVLTGLPPEARVGHSAVWIENGNRMLVFGGQLNNGVTNTAGSLDITGNSWQDAPPSALEPRRDHTAVATGDSMIVWGGMGNSAAILYGDGAIYTP